MTTAKPTSWELNDDPTIVEGPGVWQMLQIIAHPHGEDDIARACYAFSHVQWGAFLMALGYRYNSDNDRCSGRCSMAEHLFFEENTQTDYAKILRALAFAMEQADAAAGYQEDKAYRDAYIAEHGEEPSYISCEPSYREDFHADC